MMTLDSDYISDSYIELYGVMNPPMKYIPFDDSLGKTKTGKIIFKFFEDKAIDLHASFSENEALDPDIANDGTGRYDASIRIVAKELLSAGIIPKVKDAIDVVTPFWTRRYIVMGFANPPAPSSLFVVVNVTDIDKAFK